MRTQFIDLLLCNSLFCYYANLQPVCSYKREYSTFNIFIKKDLFFFAKDILCYWK